MKCVRRFTVCAVGAIAVASVAWGASYSFGAMAVAPQPAAKKAVAIDTAAFTPAAAPAAPLLVAAATPAPAAAATAPAPAAAAPAAGSGPIEGMLATADIAAGEKFAKVCATCHTFKKGEPNKIGPNLYDVVGASRARAEGFAYSAGLKAMSGAKWTYADLNTYLFKPAAFVTGSKMAYAGIKSDADRANVIAWMRSLSDAPKPLPTK